jgi:hypothetical protein
MDREEFIQFLIELGFEKNVTVWELLCEKKLKRKIVITEDDLFFKVRFQEGLISSEYRPIKQFITEKELIHIFSKVVGIEFFNYYFREKKIREILN